MGNIIVREAVDKDKTKYGELNLMFMNEVMEENPYWRKIGLPKLSEMEETFLEAINGEGNIIIFVAELEGEIVGYINAYKFYSIWSRGNAMDIDDLYVSPLHREKKAATALMNYALKYVEDNGFKRIQLIAEPDNYKAHGFYEKLGFEMKDMKFFLKKF